MKQFVLLLPLILLISSTRAIEVGWNNQDDELIDNQDEFIAGGTDIQASSDSAIRLTNGIFDLYRLLTSDNQKLNQIVSNVKQTVGKDTYDVNHVFKHIKNGNYYLELDTDKFNFAVTFVRMPNTKHIHDNGSERPSTTGKPAEPSKTTPPSTGKPAEPSKTTPPSTTAKPAEPSKTTPTSTTTKPTNATQIEQEAENLRRLEDKRFRQILGQWHLSGIKKGDMFDDDVHYRACQVITVYTHGTNYYLKTLNNAGNNTYKMTDDHIESVDKKNNLFKLNNNVYRYKTVLLEGKNYKVKLFQLSNLNNSTDVSFYTEHLVDSVLISKVFVDHYADLKLFTITQDCD
jgi:hypothetical protein